MKQSLHHVRILLLLFCLLSALALPATPARAAGVVGDGTPGSCTEAAFDTALTGGGDVSFNCGSGLATIPITSRKILAADTTIDGASNIVLNAGGTTSFFTVGPSRALTLRNITLDNGYSTGYGGAIGSSGALTLYNVTLRNNKTDLTYCGGAIYTDNQADIQYSDFDSNVSGEGGAICVTGGLVKILSSTFNLNQAVNPSGGGGGAISVTTPGALEVDGGMYSANTAVLGGAIYFSPDTGGFPTGVIGSSGDPVQFTANLATDSGGAVYSKAPQLSIDNAVFSGNVVPKNQPLFGYGGAVFNQGNLALSNSTFGQNEARYGGGVFSGGNTSVSRVLLQGNHAENLGGGMYMNNENSVVTIADTMVISNTATSFGGGIMRFNTQLTITSTVLLGNEALAGGGGLGVSAGPTANVGGYVEMQDSTIAKNTAPEGGAIYSLGEIDLGNVTVANNTSGIMAGSADTITRLYNTALINPGGANCAGTPTSSAGGNVSSDASCLLSQPSDQSGVDPLLGPLEGDGSTWFYMPLAGSPLIDAAVPPCSTLDQRHNPRVGPCDIGAVEYSPAPPPPSPAVYLPVVMK